MSTFHEQFVERVREMRAAQKKYFKTRDRVAIDEAKQLERLVDRMLKDRESQPLFPGEESEGR